MERLGVLGIRPQDLAVGKFRIGQASRPMMLHGRFKGLSNRDHDSLA